MIEFDRELGELEIWCDTCGYCDTVLQAWKANCFSKATEVAGCEMCEMKWITGFVGKPLGGKAYGHIPHLPGSRLGPGDHKCHEGQARIATVKTRDKNDRVIVQEKLDGSCVAVAKINGKLAALTRAGYLATTSPYEMHHVFARWCVDQTDRFYSVLNDGERLIGEWLYQAHGTRYNLPHGPFVAFDIMHKKRRLPFDEFMDRVGGVFVTPHVLHIGGAFSIEDALDALGEHGFHGAIDGPEGAVWRVEKMRDGKWTFNFIVKYVRPDKVDGVYLKCDPPVYNEFLWWL